jgi:hypothetical protein
MSLTNKLAFQDLHIENIPPAAMSIVEIGLRLPLLKLSSFENCFGSIRHSLTWINWPQKAHAMLSFIENIGNEHMLGCLATVLGIPRTAPASNFVVAARSIGVAKYLHHRCVHDSGIKTIETKYAHHAQYYQQIDRKNAKTINATIRAL